MSKNKEINKEELENVTGGDFGRTWEISSFRQDYATNDTTPDNALFKPEYVATKPDEDNNNNQ